LKLPNYAIVCPTLVELDRERRRCGAGADAERIKEHFFSLHAAQVPVIIVRPRADDSRMLSLGVLRLQRRQWMKDMMMM
jgi:hypothetical protein